MNNIYRLILTAVTTLVFCVTAAGASYRIDFSGLTLTPDETFSGHAILDYSVTDSDSLPDQSTYAGLVTHLELQIGGVEYTLASTVTGGDGIVFNNDVFYSDLFSITSTIEPIEGGSEPGFFLLQLIDTSNSVFFDTSLPAELNVDDFDPYTAGVFSTGVVLPTTGSTVLPLEYVHITQVPLPGGLLLLLSGLFSILFKRFA